MDSINVNAMGVSNLAALKARTKDTTFLDSIEECYRYFGPNTYGAYYPAPPLPGKYYNENYEWPIVIAAGTIVSIISYRNVLEYNDANFPGGYEPATGITADGMIYVNVGVDNTARSIDLNSAFHRGMSGFIVPANGGQRVTDAYSTKDGTYGILVTSGRNSCAAATSATAAYVREPNRPMGIVNTAVYAFNPYRYMNYNVHQNGFAIQKDGVLTVPYVKVFGTNQSNVGTVASAIRAAIDPRLQYLMVQAYNTASKEMALRAVDYLLTPGSPLASNRDGKFISYTSALSNLMVGDSTSGYQAIVGDGSGIPATGACGITDGTYQLRITVDGGDVQTMSIVIDADVTTYPNIAASIDGQLVGASCRMEGTTIVVVSNTEGAASTILIQEGSSSGLIAAMTASTGVGTASIATAVAGTAPAGSLTTAELEQQKFGKIHGMRSNVPYHMDEIIDTPLDSEIQGTDTYGLSRRMYIFAGNILGTTGVTSGSFTKADRAALLASPLTTTTAGVYVQIGMVDIAFGSMA